MHHALILCSPQRRPPATPLAFHKAKQRQQCGSWRAVRIVRHCSLHCRLPPQHQRCHGHAVWPGSPPGGARGNHTAGWRGWGFHSAALVADGGNKRSQRGTMSKHGGVQARSLIQQMACGDGNLCWGIAGHVGNQGCTCGCVGDVAGVWQKYLRKHPLYTPMKHPIIHISDTCQCIAYLTHCSRLRRAVQIGLQCAAHGGGFDTQPHVA